MPDRISRTPKSLSDFKRWKGNIVSDSFHISHSLLVLHNVASELRSWLLFYSLPVLDDVLPPVYFRHYSLLVAAIHILSSNSINHEEVDSAEEWLKKFYQQYEELYGMCTQF